MVIMQFTVIAFAPHLPSNGKMLNFGDSATKQTKNHKFQLARPLSFSPARVCPLAWIPFAATARRSFPAFGVDN
jgi:hypothetical protein